jgi:hypothetical protein
MRNSLITNNNTEFPDASQTLIDQYPSKNVVLRRVSAQ